MPHTLILATEKGYRLMTAACKWVTTGDIIGMK